MDYYILIEPWAVYVKEANFFKAQGGLMQPWGKKWEPACADSIEDAREIGVRRREQRERERAAQWVQCCDCGAMHRRIDGCPNDCHDESYG